MLAFINTFFIVIAVLGLIILWWVWPPDSPWSPWWRTNSKKAKAACKLANITSKDKVYELGSGDATFLVVAAKEFDANCIGIEIDPVRHLTAWFNTLINRVMKKVKLKRGNFLKENISDASVVFVYLVPRVLERLKTKLYDELKPGTKIVSFKYEFEVKKGDKIKFVKKDKENEMYLYKII